MIFLIFSPTPVKNALKPPAVSGSKLVPFFAASIRFLRFSCAILFFPNSSFEIYNAYFDSNLYYTLQENLYSCNIKYVDSGVDKLDNIIGEKFDLIYLSNIFETVALGDVENAFKTLDSLKKLLNPNGEVYDYCFSKDGWHFGKSPILQGEEKKKYIDDKIPQFYVRSKKLSKGIIYKYKLKGN